MPSTKNAWKNGAQDYVNAIKLVAAINQDNPIDEDNVAELPAKSSTYDFGVQTDDSTDSVKDAMINYINDKTGANRGTTNKCVDGISVQTLLIRDDFKADEIKRKIDNIASGLDKDIGLPTIEIPRSKRVDGKFVIVNERILVA